jgi:hypothetical protein
MASKINCRLRLQTTICTNSHPEMTSKHCNRFLWLHKLWNIIKTSSSHSPIYSFQNCIYKIFKNHITIPLFWRENWQKNTSHLCFLIERMLLLSWLLLKKVHHTHCPTFIYVISKTKVLHKSTCAYGLESTFYRRKGAHLPCSKQWLINKYKQHLVHLQEGN